MKKIDQFYLVNCDQKWKPLGECPYRAGSCIGEKCHKWQPLIVTKQSEIKTATPQMVELRLCQDDIIKMAVEQTVGMLNNLFAIIAQGAGQRRSPPTIMGPHG